MDSSIVSLALIIVVVVSIILFKLVKGKQINQIESVKSVVQVEVEQIKSLIPISIFYGSQQGTAAKFSKILAEEGTKQGFIINVVDLNDFANGQDMVKGKVGIFCLATHGEGDPTDNARTFAEWLKNEEIIKNMKEFNYTVFGLGNTQYEHYNRMARQTDKKLEDVGATRVYKYGEGDDNQSLEEDFNEWKQSLWTSLKESLQSLIEEFQSSDKQTIPIAKAAPNKFNYTLEQTTDHELNLNEMLSEDDKHSYEFQTAQFMKARNCTILSICQLRQNLLDGSTLNLVIDLKDTGITYKTAQNLGIFPENDPEQVQELATYLGFDLNGRYTCQEVENSLSKRKTKLPLPSPCSVKQILTQFCDFSGPIMKKTLKDLASYTTNKEYQIELERLASPAGKTEFAEKIESHKKTIFEIIKQYEIKPSLIEFIELCPRISPRIFTISSSSVKNPEQVNIVDSLLTNGLCSRYIERLSRDHQQSVSPQLLIPKKAATIRIDFRESSFKLPEDPNVPIIMIGPGTGVAPFIAFLEERKHKQLKESAPHILYFGCRHENGDFIHKDLIRQYAADKIIDSLHVAISRDQEQKIYVQDLLLKNQEEVIDLMFEKGAIIFICGSTAMGKSVHTTLIQIISSRMGEADAINHIKELEKSKRIVKELW